MSDLADEEVVSSLISHRGSHLSMLGRIGMRDSVMSEHIPKSTLREPTITVSQVEEEAEKQSAV